MDEQKTYSIWRFYSKRRPPKLIKTGLTLEQAQEHCSDPKTSKEGDWFDGYSNRMVQAVKQR